MMLQDLNSFAGNEEFVKVALQAERIIGDWEALTPGITLRTEERYFIASMCRATGKGMGYGKMQQLIEWVWQNALAIQNRLKYE